MEFEFYNRPSRYDSASNHEQTKMFVNFFTRIFLLFGCITLWSCANGVRIVKENTLVLQYQDFGPEAMAGELLGPERWPWAKEHYSTPQQFDIHVVVYRDVKLETVKKAYPVDEHSNQDYRYIEYTTAIQWHEDQLSKFTDQLSKDEGDKDYAFFFIRELYKNVLKIERALRK